MMPMQHDLPILNMPDEQFDFADWQPELPTNDNWREFKYAPTNIRMNGKTYAANCRHRTVDWDEHPWCVHCLIRAGVTMCHNPVSGNENKDHCYICVRMSTMQVVDFLSSVDSIRPRIEAAEFLDDVDTLHPRIRCQLDADFVSAAEFPLNPPPHWRDGFFGWIRPASMMPVSRL
jgi:hypothetical protein